MRDELSRTVLRQAGMLGKRYLTTGAYGLVDRIDALNERLDALEKHLGIEIKKIDEYQVVDRKNSE